MKIGLGMDLFSFIEPEASVPFSVQSSVLLVQKIFLHFFPLVISFDSFPLVFASGAPSIWRSVLLDSL